MNGATRFGTAARVAVALIAVTLLIGIEWAIGSAIVAPGSTIAAFDETVTSAVRVFGGPIHTVALIVTQLGNALVLVPFALFVGWMSRAEKSWRPAVFAAVAV